MKDMVHRIVQARREGKGSEDLPFIDALLHSGVPEEQVRKLSLEKLTGIAKCFQMLVLHLSSITIFCPPPPQPHHLPDFFCRNIS